MKTLLILLFLSFTVGNLTAQSSDRFLVLCSKSESVSKTTGFLFNDFEVTKFTDSTDAIRYPIKNVVYLKDKGQYQYRFKDYDNTRNKIIFHPESGTVLIQVNFDLKAYSFCFKE